MFGYRIDDEVEIQPLLPRHAADIFRLTDEHRAYLHARFPWVSGTRSVEDTLNFINGSRAAFAAGRGLDCAILFQGAVAGVCGFHSYDGANQLCHMGYWVRESLQGRGIVTRACAAMLRYAYRDMALHRVEIRCAEDNPRSCAVAERLGFRFEGLARGAHFLNGSHISMRLYSMLAPEWEQQQPRGYAPDNT